MPSKHLKTLSSIVTLLILLPLLISCGSAQDKRTKFYDKGKALYEKGDYVKAQLEFKNALQIDQKFAPGYFMLGMSALKEGRFQQAYGSLSKAVELDPAASEPRIELGKVLLAGRAVERAMEQVEAVLKLDPQSKDGLLLKAAVLVTADKQSEAISLLTELLQRVPDSGELFLLLTSAYQKSKQVEMAEKTALEGIKAVPGNINLHKILAGVYAQSGRLDEAIASIKKVIELDPANFTPKFTLASLYWDKGDQQLATDLLSQQLSAVPNDEDLWANIAKFYLSKKQVDQATESLQQGIKAIPATFTLRFLLSEVYVQTGKSAQAFALLNECLALDKDPSAPNILQTKNLLAQLHLQRVEYDEAKKLIDEILAESAANIDAHFAKGLLLLAQNDGSGAVAEFRTVIQEKPQVLPAYLRLAEAHISSKEFEMAVDTLQKALKVQPGVREVMKALARVYMLDQDFGKAEQQLQEMVALDRKDIVALADLGDFYLGRGQDDKAIEIYTQIKTTAIDNPLSYLKLSQVALRKNDLPGALKILLQGYKLQSGSPYLLNSLVFVYLRQNDFASAINICQKRLQEKADDYVIMNLLAKVYAAKKDFSKAEELLLQVIAKEPLWSTAHDTLAKLYLTQGKIVEAIQKFEGMLAANPNEISTQMILGLLYEKNNQYEEAKAIYRKVIVDKPTLWAAANNLAFILSDQNKSAADLQEALGLAEKVKVQNPDSPEVLDTLGWVYYRMAKFGEAKAYLESALQKSPQNPTLNYHLGALLLATDNPQEAKEKLTAALATDDDFADRQQAEKLLEKL